MMGARCAVLVYARGRNDRLLEVVAVGHIQQDVIAMLVPHMGASQEIGLAIEAAAIGRVELIENQCLYVPDGLQTIDLSSQPGESIVAGVTCHQCHYVRFVEARRGRGGPAEGNVRSWTRG